MIYINSNSTNPYFNFALEYYLLNEFTKHDSFFMLWRTEPTLMVGRYQNTNEEINSDFVKENSINVVRRITGGGTIYTDLNGWQFSFINKKIKSSKMKIDFKTYIEPVIEALAEIDVTAYFNDRNDILIDGKKFSGNAQFLRKDKVLHHGSILFDTDLETLVRALNVSDEKIISKGIKSVRDRVTNVKDYIADKNIDSVQFRDVMLNSFLKSCSSEYILTEVDIKRVHEIQEEIFENWDWIYGKNPKFNISKSNRFEGGLVQVQLDVNNGVIESCNIHGDFFAQGKIENITTKLVGTPYREADILEVLKNIEADKYIYKVSLEELLSCFI